jgi:hypothetical protein
MALSVEADVEQYRYSDPDADLPLFTASGAVGTVHWSTSSGVLSDATGATTSLSPVNRTEGHLTAPVVVTAADDNTTVETEITIYATLPVQPKWAVESDLGMPLTRWPMAYEKRTYEEYFSVVQFWQWHKQAILEISEPEDGPPSVRIVRGLPFYLADTAFSELARVFFDSQIRRSARGLNVIDYSFQLLSFDFVVPGEIPSEPQTGVMISESGSVMVAEG